MADAPAPEDHGSQEIEAFALPASVIRMWDLMLAVDPAWDIRKWLDERAVEQMDLLSAELEQEHLRTRQRLHRIENLARRLGEDEVSRADDPGQRNLFDEFDLSQPAARQSHLAADGAAVEDHEPGPLSFLTDYFPDIPNDDPLLALTSHLVLLELEASQHGADVPLAGSEIRQRMAQRGIEEDEVEEAIDYLLKHESIIEIDDDVFLPY